MPGVTSVTTVFLTGQPFLNDLYAVTIDYERHTKHISGKLLTVFDLGCQTAFIDHFTGELAEFIFSGTSALIFVVDSLAIQGLSRVRSYLEKEYECLRRFSSPVKVYVFLNKIDLIPKKVYDEVIDTITEYLNKKRTMKDPFQVFPVSCTELGIFQALDVVFNDLIDLHFPNLSLSAFKNQLLLKT